MKTQETLTETLATKHTPGPWYWQGTKGNPKLKAYLSSKDRTVFADCRGVDISEANAWLIAAAPELLAALIELRTQCIRNGFESELANQAIAKATHTL